VKVKLILPALTEATSPWWRPIKYSLFPPLGLATLAAYLDDEDEAEIQDEHVERLNLEDAPDLVVIQVYITSAYRSYNIADHYRRRGAYVVMGGLHVTSLPEEAAAHADTIFLGPGEDTWPRFLADFRRGWPDRVYRSQTRTLATVPPIRRDLIKRRLYLVPNSIVVSRGCPHVCDFCYKEAFFEGGRSFYTQTVDAALAEIDRLPGHHLYFLDDHLFGDRRFATALFEGMRGMGRLWQAAGTVNAVLAPDLLEKAVESRSSANSGDAPHTPSYRASDQLPAIAPRRHAPSICPWAVRCSISVRVLTVESLTLACHVPVIGGDPAGADATRADHAPRQPARSFSVAHVPRNRTRFPSMTVHVPCARFGVFGFTSAVQVP